MPLVKPPFMIRSRTIRSDSRWVLVDTIQSMATVLLVGDTSKSRAPLGSFLRGNPDRDTILATVSQTRRSATAQSAALSLGRTVYTEPIVGPTRHVHGVWLRVARADDAVTLRPLVWAFSWDLDRRVAFKPPVLQTSRSPVAGLWSIAEALQQFDLGDRTVATLAMVVDPTRSATATYSHARMNPPTLHSFAWIQRSQQRSFRSRLCSPSFHNPTHRSAADYATCR